MVRFKLFGVEITMKAEDFARTMSDMASCVAREGKNFEEWCEANVEIVEVVA